jgi:hypothetical protein
MVLNSVARCLWDKKASNVCLLAPVGQWGLAPACVGVLASRCSAALQGTPQQDTEKQSGGYVPSGDHRAAGLWGLLLQGQGFPRNSRAGGCGAHSLCACSPMEQGEVDPQSLQGSGLGVLTCESFFT